MTESSEYKQIASALRKVLKGKGITYEEIGERLGFSSRTIQRVINGDDYSISKLADICDSIEIKFVTGQRNLILLKGSLRLTNQ